MITLYLNWLYKYITNYIPLNLIKLWVTLEKFLGIKLYSNFYYYNVIGI